MCCIENIERCEISFAFWRLGGGFKIYCDTWGGVWGRTNGHLGATTPTPCVVIIVIFVIIIIFNIDIAIFVIVIFVILVMIIATTINFILIGRKTVFLLTSSQFIKQ